MAESKMRGINILFLEIVTMSQIWKQLLKRSSFARFKEIAILSQPINTPSTCSTCNVHVPTALKICVISLPAFILAIESERRLLLVVMMITMDKKKDTYQACTVEQLKTNLQDWKLLVSGNKSQLTELLLQNNRNKIMARTIKYLPTVMKKLKIWTQQVTNLKRKNVRGGDRD